MEENYLLRGISVALATFLGGLIGAIAIWSARRFLPHKWSFWLTMPFGMLIRRLVDRARRGRQQVLPSVQEALDRPHQRQAGPD